MTTCRTIRAGRGRYRGCFRGSRRSTATSWISMPRRGDQPRGRALEGTSPFLVRLTVFPEFGISTARPASVRGNPCGAPTASRCSSTDLIDGLCKDLEHRLDRAPAVGSGRHAYAAAGRKIRIGLLVRVSCRAPVSWRVTSARFSRHISSALKSLFSAAE